MGENVGRGFAPEEGEGVEGLGQADIWGRASQA